MSPPSCSCSPFRPPTNLVEDATLLPYRPGTSLQLEVLKNCSGTELSSEATVTIIKLFSVTMSPVMEVVIDMPKGPSVRAVLKLYDRRFGTHLRKVRNDYNPHTASGEKCFRSFVSDGDMQPFLAEYKNERKAALLSIHPAHMYDDTPAGRVRYEAALWHECTEYFTSETTAYEKLADFQGQSIPRMHAHVRLGQRNPVTEPACLSPTHLAPFLEIKGVILELITGYSLWDLPVSPVAPQDPKTWPGIVQAAVYTVHEFNKRGVILEDCDPRNVVVDQNTHTPIVVDFAQCYFRDNRIVESTEGYSAEESEGAHSAPSDWKADVEFWEQARYAHNTGAIGSVMATRLWRTRGIKLDVKYPPYDSIVESMRQNGAGGGGDLLNAWEHVKEELRFK